MVDGAVGGARRTGRRRGCRRPGVSGQSDRECSGHVRARGVVADVLAREHAVDGLLDDPEQVDGPLVERAGPGVGVEHLPFERQPVQGVGDPAVDRPGVPVLDLERVERLEQLAGGGLGDRLAPADRGEEAGRVVGPDGGVAEDDCGGRAGSCAGMASACGGRRRRASIMWISGRSRGGGRGAPLGQVFGVLGDRVEADSRRPASASASATCSRRRTSSIASRSEPGAVLLDGRDARPGRLVLGPVEHEGGQVERDPLLVEVADDRLALAEPERAVRPSPEVPGSLGQGARPLDSSVGLPWPTGGPPGLPINLPATPPGHQITARPKDYQTFVIDWPHRAGYPRIRQGLPPLYTPGSVTCKPRRHSRSR